VPLWLLGATAAVLLVACANVANLMLVRAERRRRELATRAAVGAARGRLVRQLFAEGVVLAAAGGTLGLALAAGGARLFRRVPRMPAVEPLGDGRAALFAVAVTVATTLLFALAPAAMGARAGDGAELLRAGARQVAQRAPLRTALLAVQFAASLALLGAGGLFVRSLRNVEAVDVGFDARRTLAVRADWRAFGVAPAEARAAVKRARERVRGLPGVVGASTAMMAPFSGASMSSLVVPGRPSLDVESGVPGGMFFTNLVDSAYFSTLGIRVVQGRLAVPSVGTGEREIVVSETFARRVFPGADPLGRCLTRAKEDTRCLRVVGVVADARYLKLTQAPAPIFYTVAGGESHEATTLLVRLRPEADEAAVRAGADAVRAALQAAEQRVRFAAVAPIADGMLRNALAPYRLAAAAFTVFGVLALLLAAVGLYGVVAYAVTQRTHEFGIRMALGARRVDVRRLVLRQGVRTALVGGAVGAAAAVGIGRALRSRLYDVDPLDPLSLLAVGAVLAAVTLLAAWLPARRASRVDPVVALRAE
jgi:predicted permease